MTASAPEKASASACVSAVSMSSTTGLAPAASTSEDCCGLRMTESTTYPASLSLGAARRAIFPCPPRITARAESDISSSAVGEGWYGRQRCAAGDYSLPADVRCSARAHGRRWVRSHGCSTVETMIRRLIARAFWTVSRWKLVTEPAPKRPTVLVGAPHTSNWDFVLMLAIAWSLGVEVHWLGKHSL